MATAQTAWKTDNYKFVGKEFDYEYEQFQKRRDIFKLLGREMNTSIDYEITGMDGFGELQPYDGTNRVHGEQKRGFKTIITPKEFNLTKDLGMKQVKNDKIGQSKKVGRYLARSSIMTLYLHGLDMLGRAFSYDYTGGDGKPWAATDHPVASLYSEGRGYVADPAAGTFSNLFTYALSTASIDKLRVAGDKFVSPAGLPLSLHYDMLLVSPDLAPTAAKLLGMNSRLTPMKDPDSAENAASSIADLQWAIVGSAGRGLKGNQWALCNMDMLKETALLVETTAPTIYETELDNPLIQRFVAYADFAYGFGDARPILFSNPA